MQVKNLTEDKLQTALQYAMHVIFMTANKTTWRKEIDLICLYLQYNIK